MGGRHEVSTVPACRGFVKISQCHKELLYKRDYEVSKKEAAVGEGEVGGLLT